jgi:biopolymer transport protein ExbB
MSMRKFILAAALASAAFVGATAGAAVTSIEALLEETRNARQQEAKLNQEREAQFLAERNKQAAMLAEAKAQLAQSKARSAALSAEYDANEKKLTELQGELDGRAGNLGEMFGVVRQVANDFSSVVHNSIVTAQYPDRGAFITKLAQTKSLPSIQDLERFWFELQREMTDSGTVVKYSTSVINPDGKPIKTKVTRVGPFSATSDGNYLQYLPSQRALAVMPRQPGAEFRNPARNLELSNEDYVESVVDPTRGVMLSIYAQRPNLGERIQHGESVNYIIITVGVVGALLALYQLFYLVQVQRHVRNQLRFPNAPEMDNPLGRVLSTFKGDAEKLEQDPEIVELRISEAVMRETPKLERYQAFLKLCVAAGPLLGLIGTVIGMIITFQSITESGSSDPKLMAAGISAAMIATVLGLGIAIPLLFANAWLTSISKSIVQILDEQSAGLLAARLEKSRA